MRAGLAPMIECVMQRRTFAPLNRQLAQILADLGVALECTTATWQVNELDATQTTTFACYLSDVAPEVGAPRQMLAELHRSLAELGIALSWSIDPPDRVRLLVTWTEPIDPEPGVMFRQSRTHDDALSRGDTARRDG